MIKTFIRTFIIFFPVLTSCHPKTPENEVHTSDTAIIEEIRTSDTTPPAGFPDTASRQQNK